MREIVQVVQHDLQAEWQSKDLEKLQKLGVVRRFAFSGTDEECETAWLEAIDTKDDEVLYVVEPGLDR